MKKIFSDIRYLYKDLKVKYSFYSYLILSPVDAYNLIITYQKMLLGILILLHHLSRATICKRLSYYIFLISLSVKALIDQNLKKKN